MLDSVSRARKQSGLPEECLPLLTTGNRADGKVEQVTEAFFGTAGPGGTPTPITREKIPSSESPDGEVGRALQQQAAQTVLVEEKARLAKQKKPYYQKFLDGERASLGLLRASVSPQLQPEYASLEEELSSLSDGLSQEQSSVDDFSQKLSTFQARRASFDELFVEDLRQELNIPSSAEAKEIFRGLISGWQGFVLPTEHPGIVQQNHMIKGLKIYLLPGTDILVADYSTKRFAATGTYKQVKSITRIGYGQEGRDLRNLFGLHRCQKQRRLSHGSVETLRKNGTPGLCFPRRMYRISPA